MRIILVASCMIVINHEVVFCQTSDQGTLGNIFKQIKDTLDEIRTKWETFLMRAGKIGADDMAEKIINSVIDLNNKWEVFEAEIGQLEGNTSRKFAFTCKEIFDNRIRNGYYFIDPNGPGAGDDEIEVLCINGKTCIDLDETSGELKSSSTYKQFDNLRKFSTSAEQEIEYNCPCDTLDDCVQRIPCPTPGSIMELSTGKICKLQINNNGRIERNGQMRCIKKENGTNMLENLSYSVQPIPLTVKNLTENLGFGNLTENLGFGNLTENLVFGHLTKYISSDRNTIRNMPITHYDLETANAINIEYKTICFEHENW